MTCFYSVYSRLQTQLGIYADKIMCFYFLTSLIGGRQGRVQEPTHLAEIRNSAVADSRHQITAFDGCCKVR